MNENLDLRNRILKMRKSNNLVLDQVKSESKNIVSNKEFISQKTQSNLNSQDILIESKNNVNSDPELEKKNSPDGSKKSVNSNLFKKDSTNPNSKNQKTTNQQSLNSSFSDNEAQFLIIAEKFNEAVEVILELSNKVKKLEETVNHLTFKSSKNKKEYFFLSFKTYILIILTILIILVFYTFQFDLSLIKLIIKDVVSSI